MYTSSLNLLVYIIQRHKHLVCYIKTLKANYYTCNMFIVERWENKNRHPYILPIIYMIFKTNEQVYSTYSIYRKCGATHFCL
jgi:hypothetical protein